VRSFSSLRFLVLLLFLALASCGTAVPQLPQLERISLTRWREQIPGAYRGKILVVTAWAGWCRSCVELFPHLVTIARTYQPRGVAFAGVCLDDAADQPAFEEGRRLVDEHQVPFATYLLQSEISEALAELDAQGIPLVLLYDATGKLRYQLEGDDFENEINAADIEDAIESLLAVDTP
jgi:thiol-disulfide isomerase/thioredoxin